MSIQQQAVTWPEFNSSSFWIFPVLVVKIVSSLLAKPGTLWQASFCPSTARCSLPRNTWAFLRNSWGKAQENSNPTTANKVRRCPEIGVLQAGEGLLCLIPKEIKASKSSRGAPAEEILAKLIGCKYSGLLAGSGSQWEQALICQQHFVDIPNFSLGNRYSYPAPKSDPFQPLFATLMCLHAMPNLINCILSSLVARLVPYLRVTQPSGSAMLRSKAGPYQDDTV